MSLPVPNLDDRHFQDLVDEAKRRIPRYSPQWTDHNVSDPGITLVELFAWLTEQYLFRLNQVPDKNFITFLDLIGVRLQPAQPAKGDVTFTLSAAPTPERRAIIPMWTEVATERTETEEAIVFTTDRDAEVLPPQLRRGLARRLDHAAEGSQRVLPGIRCGPERAHARAANAVRPRRHRHRSGAPAVAMGSVARQRVEVAAAGGRVRHDGRAQPEWRSATEPAVRRAAGAPGSPARSPHVDSLLAA
ncbi:MAG: putative baseplate assembly protein [Chloroflexi bacterium]|nr:MAG: putative baseplate assembly protein [Chloroflexota bacterium]